MRSCGPSLGYITHQLLSFPNATFYTAPPPTHAATDVDPESIP